MCVSIPFTSENSFLLTLARLVSLKEAICVNPLHVGELISTLADSDELKDFPFIVSIPFTSENSFLQELPENWTGSRKSVNPLHVGELISTSDDAGIFAILRIVSIPFTSENSFLPRLRLRPSSASSCVNPLHVGELISTRR